MAPILRVGWVEPGRFSYLWMKYVTGTDLAVHCARSLQGHYDSRFGPELATGDYRLDEMGSRVFYLCGVTSPYVWEENLHVAFEASSDDSFEIDEHGFRGTVGGARRLVIPAPEPRPDLPLGENPEWYTCRNWQFAVALARRNAANR